MNSELEHSFRNLHANIKDTLKLNKEHKIYECIALAILLRQYQRAYFSSKSPYLLQCCKAIEVKLDFYLYQISDINGQAFRK